MTQVLVVDDSHVIRRLVEVCLDQLNMNITTVANGTDAIAALVDDTPDLLILDVGLPDMSGWDVLEFVRGHSKLLDTSVLMLTALSDADMVRKAADKGADAYLLKPFRPDDLRRAAMNAVHGTPAAAH